MNYHIWFNHNHSPFHYSNKPNPKLEKTKERGTCSYTISNKTPKTTKYHVGAVDQYTEVQNLINVNQPNQKAINQFSKSTGSKKLLHVILFSIQSYL